MWFWPKKKSEIALKNAAKIVDFLRVLKKEQWCCIEMNAILSSYTADPFVEGQF